MASHAILSALDHIAIELSRTGQSSEVYLSEEQCSLSSEELQTSTELGSVESRPNSSSELPEAAPVRVPGLLPPGEWFKHTRLKCSLSTLLIKSAKVPKSHFMFMGRLVPEFRDTAL